MIERGKGLEDKIKSPETVRTTDKGSHICRKERVFTKLNHKNHSKSLLKRIHY